VTQRRLEVAASPDVAFERLQRAFATIGKVEETNLGTRSLNGKARYGMNPVRLRISVLSGPSADTAVLDIQGRGQDVWGVASRKVIDRLAAALASIPSETASAAETDANGVDEESGPNAADAIRQLAALRDDGLISPEEFETKRKELLDRL